MATQATTHAAPIARPNLLRYALRGDAIVSAAAGAICLAAAQQLADIIGIQPPLALRILGAMLAVYGGVLFYTAAQPQINRRVAIAAVVLNVLWVIDSAVLLVAGWLPLTSAGVWTIALIAVGVAIFAELQFFGLRRMR